MFPAVAVAAAAHARTDARSRRLCGENPAEQFDKGVDAVIYLAAYSAIAKTNAARAPRPPFVIPDRD